MPLILAAGASTRMGRPKAALPFGETTALGLVLDACARAGLAAPLVVAGADPAAVRAAAGGRPHTLVENPRWAEGRATSIQAGLAALPPEAAAFLLWPVDVVLPGADVVLELVLAREREAGRRAWVPSHAGRRGHPVLFAREVAPRFLALAPDAPARDVVRALAAEGALLHVETDDPGVLLDMNTPEDHAARVAEWRARGR